MPSFSQVICGLQCKTMMMAMLLLLSVLMMMMVIGSNKCYVNFCQLICADTTLIYTVLLNSDMMDDFASYDV